MARAIIFDFDLTLADSTKGIIECVNFALEKLNLPRADDEQIKRTIGMSLGDTFLSLTGQTNNQNVSLFVSNFVKRADQVMVDVTSMFASVPATTERLIEMGFSLGIVSTKFRYRIEEILAREGLSNRFGVIIGGEDVAEHKPHPGGLTAAIARLYVGDSTIDALTAERAKVPFIAVLSGATSKSEFDEVPKVAVIDDISALPRLLCT
ncbi:MAG: HAD hydrolase-like protein [Candidatus Latescibacteria bacterium]|nr:HAD hydrolase-like protein [Candidatus Latescibacterota bacterium]